MQRKRPSVHPKFNALQKGRTSLHGKKTSFLHPKTESLKKNDNTLLAHEPLVTAPTAPSHYVLPTTSKEHVSSKENSSSAFHPTISANPHLNIKETNSSARIHTSSSNALLSIKQRSNTNTSDLKSRLLAHFHQDNNGSDGVDFSVKSPKKHHRGRGKKDEAIDVEDLGDADFDIMMSNDIPHKDLPKKEKHAGKDEEKQHDTKDDDSVKKKKMRKDKSHVKDDDDDAEESGKSSTHHSTHRHKDKIEEMKKSSSSKHHHRHHHQHQETDADDDDGRESSNDEDEHKNTEKPSHHRHRKHGKSHKAEQKDSESENHHHAHKKRTHHAKKVEKDDSDDDSDIEESKHAKHHHNDAKEDEEKHSRNDDSEDDEKNKHHHHHNHKKHSTTPKIKYDDNHWEGKIIPGKVKLTYEEDREKKRHRKHKIQNDDDNSKMTKKHHKRKHPLRVHETHSDSDEEDDVRKRHRHSKERKVQNHKHKDDDYKRNEKHTRYREEDEEKHHTKDEHKKEKHERAEKRTDVNYEVVKKYRHRLVHNEDNDDDDNDNESSKRKHDDKDDDGDDKQNDDSSEEDKGSGDDNSDDNENTKHSRVVLGEDSESDDEDEDKHPKKIHTNHDRHRHANEHKGDERENVAYDSDYHKSNSHEEDKPALHNRHKQERHHESHLESNENDDDNESADEGNNIRNGRRNFKKSVIYHRKKKKQRIWRKHHEREKDREKENNDNQVKEFHNSHKYRHYKHHGENDQTKMEKYEDRYEPKAAHDRDNSRHGESDYERNHDDEHNDEQMHDYNKQHKEREEFRSRDNMKEHRPNVELEKHNYKHFHYKKERHRGGYSSHEDDDNDDQEARKYKENSHSRKHEGPQYRHQDAYEHRFMGSENPHDDDTEHRTDYNKGRKYKPRYRKKWHWKNRHHFHNQEEHDFEGTGGSFDSSAWMRDENSDDDRYYGGEGNQEYYRKKHRKHKHRKHRQSYEYWGYRGQNPYYYNYNYHKSPPRYGYYKPQPDVRPPAEWHKQHYGGYDRWKPKPTSWYPNKEHWDRKSSWRSHSNWPPIQEKRPTKYQWQTFYNDHRIANPPKPTPYPREPPHVWRPTNPRWQQPDETQQRFGGNNNWPPDHGQGPGKQYSDWSKNGPSAPLNQDGSKYGPPQQNPTSGLQPWRNPNVSKPGGQQQPTGVQSKYFPPAQQQKPNGENNQTRFRPTVRRQYPAAPPPQVASPTNISQIKNIMDKLNTPPSVVGVEPASNVSTAHQGPANNKNGLPKTNKTDQIQDRNRLNGFFNEENEGKKKSEIVRPANSSQHRQDSRNSSSSANASQHVQPTPPKTTNTPAKLPPQSTQGTNKTTIGHTTPMQTTSNHTSKPTKAAQNSSTTAVPTQTTTTQHTPAGPNFGDVSQPDDSSETGKKHRKHRAPVCNVGKTTDDVTLLRGKRAGNFTNIGDVGDFDMCIKRCCQHQKCDLAFKSAETCFLVKCFSKESCQTSPALDDIFSPQMCFVKRHPRDEEKDTPEQDGDDEWNDKVSPSGIREVCDVEKALGIMWKKTVAGRYSAHPCPRGAKGFVKRRCEADSRWLPPDFSECVSNDYQTLYDKSKKLATGTDPSPLIRELSQLTTQNIDNSLIFGGDLNRATDIMAAIVQHNGQTELLDMTREDVENFVRASSNLLDMTNQQEWINIQKNKPGTADVLRSMEMFALQAAMRLPREDMADPTITNNIIIKMDRKSAGDDGLTFPDFSNPKISRWDARHDVIALPSSVFERGEVSTASISFKSLPYLLPDSNVSTGLGPNSKVISTVLHPHPQGKITPPVTVVLSHIKRRRGNPKCVFWDYTLNPHRGGAWSSRGCWLAFSNHSHSICQCSHLSNFAVLMDLSSDEVSQKEQKRERTMALMWIGIPVLIVGVIGGLYMSFSWNRKSGMPSTITRSSAALNEKTGLLGQRVVTSQVREEFPASPSRDLYRALSPGYSPTGDLEWQDEFDFEMEGSGDQGFKQMLLPKLQMLQNHLINEFYDVDKMETKTKKLLESKIQQKSEITAESPIQPDVDHSFQRETIQQKPQITVQSPVQSDAVDSIERQTIQATSETKVDSAVQSERVRTSVNSQLQATQAKPLVKNHIPVKSPTLQKFDRQTKTSSSRKLRVRFADQSPPGRNLTDEDKERFKRLQRMERRVFVQHLSRWTASSHLNLSE